MQLHRLVETSERVSKRSSRLEKISQLADLLRGANERELPIVVAYLSGELRQGRIGIGPATLRAAMPDEAAAKTRLTLAEVDDTFARIAEIRGPGSNERRITELRGLLVRATPMEQGFLTRLLLGELRQGAQEGLMAEAIAEAADVDAREIRRALMLSGDLTAVARSALTEAGKPLDRFALRLFRPIQPMLAQTAEDIAEALNRLGEAAFEHKLDGARIQVHRSGAEVRVYTRRLNDVTVAVPEVADAVAALAVDEVILDGEVIALRADGTPLPFQTTMRRFGRRRDVKRMREELPLSPFFFDCLYLAGESLLDRPAAERFEGLVEAVPSASRVARVVTGDRETAERFLEAALEAGHEGVMAKDLSSTYEAGARGRTWLKVKPAHTLDLVVLAAEWGHGRRHGWLSNLHLGARDPETGDFVMLGKTFKGMTDEMLEWQTERLQELEVDRDAHTVYVRPELIVEVAFDGVQESPHYPAGLALRFARVKGYRPDKDPEEADTIETVRRIHDR